MKIDPGFAINSVIGRGAAKALWDSTPMLDIAATLPRTNPAAFATAAQAHADLPVEDEGDSAQE